MSVSSITKGTGLATAEIQEFGNNNERYCQPCEDLSYETCWMDALTRTLPITLM